MSLAIEPRARTLDGEHRFLIQGVGWEGYQILHDLIGDRSIRVTYDRGDIELMSPRFKHENYKGILGYMIEALTDEFELSSCSAGSTTIRSQNADRGLEPDESFYLANVDRVPNHGGVDVELLPPPDLAIEVEMTKSALGRLGIYAALGVPEVWRFDGETVAVHLLCPDGTYEISGASAALPYVSMEEITEWLLKHEPSTEGTWRRAFRAWVRDVVVPRRFRDDNMGCTT
jgi:Uma2 family endonuclease